MIKISIPVVLGRFTFSFGKVIVNYLATVYYGAGAIAALSITYKANLGVGVISSSSEEVETTLISQNLGNKNPKRAFKTVSVATIYTMIFTILGAVLIALLMEPAVKFFISKPTEVTASAMEEYYLKIEMAKELLKFEILSILANALTNVLLGGFYGFKLTKISYIVNIVRLFIFRIPILILLYYFASDIGYKAVGLTMALSNIFTAILLGVFFLIFYFKNKANNFIHYLEVA